MQNFPIDKIFVDRENRQRRDLNQIDQLAESIRRLGLINPVTITEEGKLIAGERRLTACKKLGLTSIAVRFFNDLSPGEQHLIELEENICRVDITWQERAKAIKDFHTLNAERDETWTANKTAEALNLSANDVSRQRRVADALEDPDVKKAETFTSAHNIVDRKEQRKKKAAVAEIIGKKTVPLENVDFIQWIDNPTVTDVNFVHCDFPYGIRADRHDSARADVFGGYEDTEDTYSTLIDTLESAIRRGIIAKSAHLIFWFSPIYYHFTYRRLSEMGWRVNPYPLIWHRAGNSGILPDPTRGPRQVYETAFLASIGDRKIIRATSNLYNAPTEKTIHMSEKPKPVLRYFFGMLVDDSTIMLDPTCGSANAVAVAKELSAASYRGLEVNTDFYNAAVAAFPPA